MNERFSRTQLTLFSRCWVQVSLFYQDWLDGKIWKGSTGVFTPTAITAGNCSAFQVEEGLWRPWCPYQFRWRFTLLHLNYMDAWRSGTLNGCFLIQIAPHAIHVYHKRHLWIHLTWFEVLWGWRELTILCQGDCSLGNWLRASTAGFHGGRDVCVAGWVMKDQSGRRV